MSEPAAAPRGARPCAFALVGTLFRDILAMIPDLPLAPEIVAIGQAAGSAEVLLLPGLYDSPEGHWQCEWQRLFGFSKVEFGNWEQPSLQCWIEALEQRVGTASSRVILVAHSLGCLATAWWARQSRHVDAVTGALLVAPPDVNRLDCPRALRDFRPAPVEQLPFRSVVVASRDDPYARFEASQTLAQRWGSELVDCGNAGHINAESGLGCWSTGLILLRTIVPDETPPPVLDRSHGWDSDATRAAGNSLSIRLEMLE